MDYSKGWISQTRLDRILAACPARRRPGGPRRRASVNVYPHSRGKDWEWRGQTVNVGAAWDRLVDAERVHEFRHGAFWWCVSYGGCESRRGQHDWSHFSAAETVEGFDRRWREAFAQVGARQNGKSSTAERLLEECRTRNIPVEVHPVEEPASVDCYPYSTWLNLPVDGHQRFYDRQRAVTREFEATRRRPAPPRRLADDTFEPQRFFFGRTRKVAYGQWSYDNDTDIADDVRRFKEAARTTWGEDEHSARRYFLNQYRQAEEG